MVNLGVGGFECLGYGNNAYVGGTTFTSGVGVQALTNASLGAAGAAVTVNNSGFSSNADFRFDTGGVTTTRAFTVASGATMSIGSFSGGTTFNGAFSGGGSFSFTGPTDGNSIALGAQNT